MECSWYIMTGSDFRLGPIPLVNDGIARVRYREHFTGIHVGNAVYSHAWDPAGQRMFTAGGPLAYGLCGSYMACWD